MDTQKPKVQANYSLKTLYDSSRDYLRNERINVDPELAKHKIKFNDNLMPYIIRFRRNMISKIFQDNNLLEIYDSNHPLESKVLTLAVESSNSLKIPFDLTNKQVQGLDAIIFYFNRAYNGISGYLSLNEDPPNLYERQVLLSKIRYLSDDGDLISQDNESLYNLIKSKILEEEKKNSVLTNLEIKYSIDQFIRAYYNNQADNQNIIIPRRNKKTLSERELPNYDVKDGIVLEFHLLVKDTNQLSEVHVFPDGHFLEIPEGLENKTPLLDPTKEMRTYNH